MTDSGATTAATSTAATIAAASPATVRVGRDGRGVGVVVASGAVATNAHNRRGAEVTITVADGRSAGGAVRGVEADGDLAVVVVDTGESTPVAWSATVPPELGAEVWTVTPAGANGVRITTGLVSSVGQPFRGPGGRLIAGSIEHTAPLPRGSSGGPLLDPAGALIGINTHRLSDGFYLAIPADAELRRRVDALRSGQAPGRRRLGVALVPTQAARRLRASVGLPERDGLLVRGVEETSPAGRAGLRRGDLIVACSGAPIASADDLFRSLDGEGSHLELTLVRGVEEIVVPVAFEA